MQDVRNTRKSFYILQYGSAFETQKKKQNGNETKPTEVNIIRTYMRTQTHTHTHTHYLHEEHMLDYYFIIVFE